MEHTHPNPADAGSIKAGPFHLPYRVEGSGHPVIVIGTQRGWPGKGIRPYHASRSRLTSRHRRMCGWKEGAPPQWGILPCHPC
jgi:hypothetical protein